MNKKTFAVDPETLEILRCGSVEGKIFKLPEITLNRKQYELVNAVLMALGAKWDKKSRGHVFDYDIKSELENVIATGIVTDWKKSTDFFYTPEAVVNEMLGLVPHPILGAFTVLEPSAGQGHILDVLKDNFPNANIIAIEQNPMHCNRLVEKGYEPINDDFLNIDPTPVEVVLMNPPFTYQREHIKHAYNFLESGGLLISVAASNIITDSKIKKHIEFNEWFESVGGAEYNLPQNSFKESGTCVSTKLIVIEKI